MKNAVFFNDADVVAVGTDWYEKLKVHAYQADRKRARLCLHRSPEAALHEMLIVFHRDAVIQPHRHLGKSESYHVVFGELDILLFDDTGHPTQIIRMGDFASGKPHVYRQEKPVWHSVIIRSEYSAIHEVTNGPFRAEDSDFASWAPTDEAALRLFLERASQQISNPA